MSARDFSLSDRSRDRGSPRRSALIDLTEDGRRLLDEATPTFHNELRSWIADALAAQSLDQLASSIAALRRAMEDAQIGMPTG